MNRRTFLLLFVILSFGLADLNPTTIDYRAAAQQQNDAHLISAAREAMRHENPEAAIKILETVHDSPDVLTLRGFCYLRLAQTENAEKQFRAAIEKKTEHPDASLGLGYLFLQKEDYTKATEFFRVTLKSNPDYADALIGLGVSLLRTKRLSEAITTLEKAVTLSSGEERKLAEKYLNDAKELMAAITIPPKANFKRPDKTEIFSRVEGELFLLLGSDGIWRPTFLRGVNIGAAMPGCFPSEFPLQQSVYDDWLEKIGQMHANVVRLYTILPPAFYAALADYNRLHKGQEIWLIHGVWTELPEDDNFNDPEFLKQFEDEMERVTDLLHGRADLPARPGHASGSYRADVSRFTLAIILGREWEPYSVVNFDRLASNSPKKFSGRYISIENGTPTEVWMAARMDKMIALSMNSYNQQYPIAFTNWPTLDPLVHPTEATKEEEIALYKKLGRRIAGELKEYDNDAVGLDMGKTKATVNFPAGIFASYHAYPYYPDFMNLDPTYRKTIGSNGINAYLGYLLDLKRHHKGEPVLIAETGVPSNRETAHLQPQGWNHGGHNEKQQAEINVQLVETIREAGLSGVLMFAWIDEWFKHNWIVLPFEIPAERTRLWHNVQDAEQNYGLVAMKAGSGNFLIDGDVKEWKDIPALLSETTTQSEPTIQSDVAVKSLKVTSDESYLRLCLEFNNLDSDKDGSTDWDKFSLLIGIDTYDLKDQNGQPIGLGDHSLPNISNLKISSGNEFLIELISPQKSRLLVDNNYDIFTHRYNRPYSSKFNEDGIFIEQIAETNRERIGRDATIYPAQRVNRSPFRYGKETEGDSLSEWAVDIKNSSIEMRIPWGLLYVTDPSSRLVLHDDLTKSKEIGTHQTEGFRFSVVATNRSRVISTLPKAIGQTIPLSPVYQWKTWEKPTYHSYLKPAYYALQNCFLKIAKQEDYLK